MNTDPMEFPERYRHDLEVIRQAAALLQKDLAAFGVEIRFSGDVDNAYGELKDQLLPVVDRLGREQPGQLRAMLYRIDVDENKVRSVMAGDPASGHADRLAHLILEKELTKAVIRKLYSASRKGK